MSQVVSNQSDDPVQAMRREAAYYTQIVLPSGRTITGDEAVAFTSMFAGRTSDDADDDPGDLCDCTEPATNKRHRLAKRAAIFHKITNPTRHWWQRHHKKH